MLGLVTQTAQVLVRSSGPLRLTLNTITRAAPPLLFKTLAKMLSSLSWFLIPVRKAIIGVKAAFSAEQLVQTGLMHNNLEKPLRPLFYFPAKNKSTQKVI